MKIIYPFSSILFCIGGFLILAIIVTFGVTISEVKLNPVSSMRPKANVNFKDRKLNDHKQVSTFSLSLPAFATLSKLRGGSL